MSATEIFIQKLTQGLDQTNANYILIEAIDETIDNELTNTDLKDKFIIIPYLQNLGSIKIQNSRLISEAQRLVGVFKLDKETGLSESKSTIFECEGLAEILIANLENNNDANGILKINNFQLNSEIKIYSTQVTGILLSANVFLNMKKTCKI